MNFKQIPKGLYVIAVIFSAFSLIGPYFTEVITGFAVLILIFALFWRQGTPPVIVAALSFMWLGIVSGFLYISLTDAEMVDMLWRPQYSLENMTKTFWIALAGLISFSFGLKAAIYGIKPLYTPPRLLYSYSTDKIIILYAGFTFFSDALFSFARFTIPGIAQPLNILMYIKWALLYIMLYVALKKKERLPLITMLIILEVIIGFTGYFSEFKNILIMLPIVYLTFNRLQGSRQISFITLFAVLLFNLGAVWSYVKMDYRMFLSGGERAQIVTVSETEALSKLAELTGDLTAEAYQIGVEAMVKRVFFLEYFSATVNNIPERRPFMDGENYMSALRHIFMPRMFFPNKPAIDDSKVTQALTGIQVADASQGTSISVGFMGQAYADYGRFFMYIPIFILGYIMGRIYRFFLKSIKNPLWAYGMLFPMYFLISVFGRNIVKIMGDLIMYFLVFYLFVTFVLPYFDRFIRKKYPQT